MTEAERTQQINDKESELRCLTSALSFSSEYGDYKVIKIYEARLQEREDPYNLQELIAKRDEVRARINTLQHEIETLQKAKVKG